MIARHPLDGNAIAADLHFNQPRCEDFDACICCGADFGADDQWDAQHPDQVGLCLCCGDGWEDEQ